MSVTRLSMVLLFVAAAFLAQAQEYVISTFAGGAPPPTPVPGVNFGSRLNPGLATDAMGSTYFVGSHCVFKLDQNGVVTRIAGNGRPGYSGDGGPATIAQLRLDSIVLNAVTSGLPHWLTLALGPLPPGIAVDRDGNVYVADNGNSRVRKISAAGIITTVAGSGTQGFSGDGGPAIGAQLSPVFGLAVDLEGNLLIADSEANRIRRVAADGSIATVAGDSDCGLTGDGGPAVGAQLCGPTEIAADSVGDLFVADTGNNRIRRISPDGSITTVAGTGASGWYCTELCQPSSVATDHAGNLYANETETDGWWIWQVVKKVSPSGTITTVAGLPCSGFPQQPPCGADGTTATKTFLGGPLGLAVDNTGNLLVADYSSQRISKVSLDGAILTMVGSCRGLPMFDPPDCQKPFFSDGVPATTAQLAGPEGVAVDAAGNVFIADQDRIRKVAPDGIITTLAGDGGPAANAQMAPSRLTLDGAGNLFFFDIPNGNIRKISPDGIINTVIHVGGNDYFVTLDRANDLFIADPNNTLLAIAEVSPAGSIRRIAGGACGIYPCSGFLGDGGPATSAGLSGAQGVAVDATGNVFIADSQDHRIRKVTPGGTITTVAGSSPLPGKGGFSGDGGPAVDAQLNYPTDVAVDGAGNLYIDDYENQRIRRVSPDGVISTIAGNGAPGYSGDGGPATRASLCFPSALAVDGAGNIYVADSCNNAIRVLRPISPGRQGF